MHEVLLVDPQAEQTLGMIIRKHPFAHLGADGMDPGSLDELTQLAADPFAIGTRRDDQDRCVRGRDHRDGLIDRLFVGDRSS